MSSSSSTQQIHDRIHRLKPEAAFMLWYHQSWWIYKNKLREHITSFNRLLIQTFWRTLTISKKFYELWVRMIDMDSIKVHLSTFYIIAPIKPSFKKCLTLGSMILPERNLQTFLAVLKLIFVPHVKHITIQLCHITRIEKEVVDGMNAILIAHPSINCKLRVYSPRQFVDHRTIHPSFLYALESLKARINSVECQANILKHLDNWCLKSVEIVNIRYFEYYQPLLDVQAIEATVPMEMLKQGDLPPCEKLEKLIIRIPLEDKEYSSYYSRIFSELHRTFPGLKNVTVRQECNFNSRYRPERRFGIVRRPAPLETIMNNLRKDLEEGVEPSLRSYLTIRDHCLIPATIILTLGVPSNLFAEPYLTFLERTVEKYFKATTMKKVNSNVYSGGRATIVIKWIDAAPVFKESFVWYRNRI